MSEQRIKELEEYVKALEAENETLKKDLSECLDVTYGILNVLGIDPDNPESTELRKLIKSGIGIFQKALLSPTEFSKQFAFTKQALDIARRYPRP